MLGDSPLVSLNLYAPGQDQQADGLPPSLSRSPGPLAPMLSLLASRISPLVDAERTP